MRTFSLLLGVGLTQGCADQANIHASATMLPIERIGFGQTVEAAAKQPALATAPQWWMCYGDPQLGMIVAAATAENPSIAATQARLAQAVEIEAVASADAAPMIDGVVGIDAQRFPANFYYPPPYANHWGTLNQALVSARYSIDFWGKRRETVAALTSVASARQQEQRDALLQLRESIVDAYLALFGAYALHDISQDAVQTDEQQIILARTLAGAKLGNQITVANAAVTLTAEQSRLDGLTHDIQRRRNELAALAGRDPAWGDGLQRPRIELPPDPMVTDTLPLHLIADRPDVLAERDSVEAAAHRVGVARTAFYPDVNLASVAGLQSLSLSHFINGTALSAGVTPSISLPIFEGGRLRAQLRADSAAYDSAVDGYNATVIAAAREVADAVSAVRTQTAQREQAILAVQDRRRVVDLTQKLQMQGFATRQDLLAARLAWLDTRRNVVITSANLAVAQTALIRALGGRYSPAAHPLLASLGE